MEDTLRGMLSQVRLSRVSLNPCFNGRYSQSGLAAVAAFIIASLNPCFNGRYSQSDTTLEY